MKLLGYYIGDNTEHKYAGSVYSSASTEWGVEDERTGQECKGICPTPRPPHVSVEKVDGGLLVAGVVVFNSCQFILPAFGCLFLVVGTVLTVTSYQGVSTSDKVQQYIERVEFTKNSRLLGPICLLVAFLMIFSGLILCIVSKRARLKQKRIGFHCPIHGDFYPANPIPVHFAKHSKRSWACCGIDSDGEEEDLVGLPPPCPHSTISSQRSSFSSNAYPIGSPCPAPLPFVVTSGSLSGLTSGTATLPSEFVFGSIRSLSVSHDVASFPASRSPSPTPVDRVSPAPSPVNVIEDITTVDAAFLINTQVVAKVTPEIKLVAPAPTVLNVSTLDTINQNDAEPRRKSVTILLPGEERQQ